MAASAGAGPAGRVGAAGPAAAAEDDGAGLWELLRGGWAVLEELEGGAEPAGQAQAQAKVQRGIGLLERAAQALAQLDLFSRQEELEEVASADLRFMVLPALLGALLLRRAPAAPQRRLQDLRRARASFADFLRLAHDYGLGPAPPPRPRPLDGDDDADPAPADPPATPPRPPPPNLLAMAAARQAKIHRYKQRKEMENRLATLRPFVEAGQAEEEQVREYYLLQITKWVHISLDEIESIDQEATILSRRDALQQEQETSTQPRRAPRPPMKPFILTRDAAQAKVFGAGYPGVATVTVDEWYEQHQKRGVLPDQGLPRAAPGAEEQQKEPEEGQAEEEEEESVWKAREWDDWKDMHPRGYGNRKNMG